MRNMKYVFSFSSWFVLASLLSSFSSHAMDQELETQITSHSPTKQPFMKLKEELIEKNDIKTMVEILNNTQIEEIIEHYMSEIEKGNVQAMNGLGKLYETYDFSEQITMNEYVKNKKKFKYFGLDQENFSDVLSTFYKINAAKLYKQASDLGNEEGTLNLKTLCETWTSHKDPTTDHERAAMVMRDVIQGQDVINLNFFGKLQGYNPPSLCSASVLSWMYENGYGVEKNLQKAFVKAVHLLYPQNKDEELVTFGVNKNSRKFEKILLSHCDKIVEKIYKTMDLQDIDSLTLTVEVCFMYGYKLDEIREHLVKISEKENNNNNDLKGEALYWLGYMYQNGIIVEKNTEQAKMFYKKAANLGCLYAEYTKLEDNNRFDDDGDPTDDPYRQLD